MQTNDTEIKQMFDAIITKIDSLSQHLEQLNKNIRFLSDTTTTNVKNLNLNVNKFVIALDNIFHMNDFEKMAQELEQTNEVVKYELDKANVDSLLSNLAEKVLKLTSILEKNGIIE
ncbi:MAG: hypothetical protein EAX96_04850 [Candidatus Lokiarchaeota archaeon]|nr:hypothetical protein [Candidatus Lokiarchaeota archaeon]